MYYERSAETWIQDALVAINKESGSDGGLFADYRGSRDGKQAILYGADAGVEKGKKFEAGSKSAPILWNPADIYWADKLNADWKNPKIPNKGGSGEKDVVSAPTILLNTRLVLAMWNDRAAVFEKLAGTSKYKNKTWALLHDLATTGWSLTGNPSWGKLKLAQSDPTRSNSGLLALRLMFAEWQASHPNAKPSDAAFVAWMRAIEGSVPAGEFADTTGNALEAMLAGGAAKYDAAVAYEQNVLARVAQDKTLVRILYPTPTLAVQFPVMEIQAGWVSEQQGSDARAVIQYLTSEPIQKKAVSLGFRPGSSGLKADALETEANNKIGFRMDVVLEARATPTDVIDSLIYLWGQSFAKQN